MGRFRRMHGDHRLLRGVAPLNMVGFPGVFRFVLGDAVGVLAGMPESGPILIAGPGAAQVGEGQLDGPPDGGVGPVALPEAVAAAIHPNPGRHRAVHHHQRSGNVRRTLHRRQVEPGPQQRLYGRNNHRKIIGATPGHHRVGGQLGHGGPPSARGDFADQLQRGTAAGGVQKGAHPRRRGRDDGQAISPAGGVGQRQRLVIVIVVAGCPVSRCPVSGCPVSRCH